MKKRYASLRIDKETNKNFNIKTDNLNKALKKLGLKKTVTKIELLKMLSKKPVYLDNGELVKLAKKQII